MPLAVHWLPIWHGKEHDAELVFVVEDKFFKSPEMINSHRVMSMTDFLSVAASERRYSIAIGDSMVRQRIANSIPPDVATPFSIFCSQSSIFDGKRRRRGGHFMQLFTHHIQREDRPFFSRRHLFVCCA